MGILDDVFVNAKSGAEVVGKKALNLVDTAKLRIGILEINADVNKKYESLGSYVYENCRDALSSDADAMSKFAELDELKSQCESIEKELLERTNKVVCKQCGRKCDNSDVFCGTCGAKLTEE